METFARILLSVFLIGLVVMTIVFFSIFGLFPAEKLTQIFSGEPAQTSTSTQNIIFVSTTTVIERIIERVVPADPVIITEPKLEPEPEPEPPVVIENEEEPRQPVEQNLPPVVFNTSGKIKSIDDFVLFIASDGSHMSTIPASRVVDIEVEYIGGTRVLDSDNNEIEFSELSVGDSVSVESSENIKNETEFRASNIRITN